MARRTKKEQIVAAISSLVVWEQIMERKYLDIRQLCKDGFSDNKESDTDKLYEEAEVALSAIRDAELRLQELGVPYESRTKQKNEEVGHGKNNEDCKK